VENPKTPPTPPETVEANLSRIVEHEQQGADRAEYGKNLLRDLATRLTSEFGPGFSKSSCHL